MRPRPRRVRVRAYFPSIPLRSLMLSRVANVLNAVFNVNTRPVPSKANARTCRSRRARHLPRNMPSIARSSQRRRSRQRRTRRVGRPSRRGFPSCRNCPNRPMRLAVLPVLGKAKPVLGVLDFPSWQGDPFFRVSRRFLRSCCMHHGVPYSELCPACIKIVATSVEARRGSQ